MRILMSAVLATCFLATSGQMSFAQSSTRNKPAAEKPSAKKPETKKPETKQEARNARGKPAAETAAKPGKPALVASFGDWGAYVASAGKAKTCYALAEPKDRQPSGLKRDKAYIFVSTRTGEGVSNELSVIMGFDVKGDSTPRAEIGPTGFDMVAQKDKLWVRNAAEEGHMLDAMRKGQRLSIKAQSLRGSTTTDNYSLSGLGQALDRVRKECQ